MRNLYTTKFGIIFLTLIYTSVIGYTQSSTSDDVASVNNSSSIVEFSVGGNLNLIEEGFINGLYYDINAFIPDQWNRFGIEGRLAQGRLVVQNDTSNLVTTFSEISSDTTQLLRQDFRFLDSEKQSYLNISMNPTYKFTEGLFGVLFIDYFQQRIESTGEFIVESSDTIPFSQNVRISRINLDRRKSDQTNHFFNYALGLKIFIEASDNVTLNIKPTLGASNLASSGDPSIFYYTNFEVEEREFGFKIGGEIRGYIGKNNPTRFNEPLVNIYAAKIFGFSKLKDRLFNEGG
ncbi:MAG: hypothetical protein RJQ09_14590 [Cyclobacteriaceae bacterium]